MGVDDWTFGSHLMTFQNVRLRLMSLKWDAHCVMWAEPAVCARMSHISGNTCIRTGACVDQVRSWEGLWSEMENLGWFYWRMALSRNFWKRPPKMVLTITRGCIRRQSTRTARHRFPKPPKIPRRGHECGTLTGRGRFLTAVTFSFWGLSASSWRMSNHGEDLTAADNRLGHCWRDHHKTLKTRHSSNTIVCHGINRSFRNGCTRAAGPTWEQTHPLTPKQEALLTGCILGNSKKRTSLQHPGRCRKTQQSLLTQISRMWCLLRPSPFWRYRGD